MSQGYPGHGRKQGYLNSEARSCPASQVAKTVEPLPEASRAPGSDSGFDTFFLITLMRNPQLKFPQKPVLPRVSIYWLLQHSVVLPINPMLLLCFLARLGSDGETTEFTTGIYVFYKNRDLNLQNLHLQVIKFSYLELDKENFATKQLKDPIFVKAQENVVKVDGKLVNREQGVTYSHFMVERDLLYRVTKRGEKMIEQLIVPKPYRKLVPHGHILEGTFRGRENPTKASTKILSSWCL